MLQQTPESKRLPLHRIHGRRLSTKDFHYSAPETASSASTTFTKIKPNVSLSNATLVPPPAHGGMYYNEPQQPYHATHVEVATTLWPPDTTNYWFPNWKELFHGFLVVEKGHPRQAFAADFARQQKPGSPPQGSSTRPPHMSSDNAYTFLHNHPSSQQPRPTCGQYPLPIPSSSHSVTQSPSMRQERDQAQIENANKAFSSPSKAPGAITKCSVKSPLWLPQGWITEIHTRRTGSTAGMRDKYFKHLASGRRFRSRKDVLHFTSTGRSRIRKQSSCSRALMVSTGHSLMKTFAHRKRSILGGLKPFSESYSEKKLSTHVVNSLLPGLSQPRLNDDLGLPYKQSSNSLCSSSKESAKERAHKLPVKKKSKTSPSRIDEEKQASKLWQWLTKPVARDNGTSLHQEMLTLSFSSPGVEKKTANMADEKSVKDLSLSLRHQTAHRANQLSKEIQAAHDDVVQMSREMQATAEKLSREISVAKKDVGLANEMEGSKWLCVVLGDDAEPGKRCRSNIEALSYATSVHKASSNATNDLPKAAHSSTVASSSVICGASRPDNTSSIPKDCCYSLPMNQPTAWPNMMVHSKVQMATMVNDPIENGTQTATRHGDAVGHATQPVQTTLEGCIQRHVFPTLRMPEKTEERVAANGDVIHSALRPCMLTVHAQSSLQISIATERSASANCDMTQPAHEITDGARITGSHVLETNGCSEKPDEVAEANNEQAAGGAMGPSPVLLKRQAIPSLGMCSNAMVQDAAGEVKPGIFSYETHLSGPCSGLLNGTQETDSSRNVKWQPMDEVIARRLRRKKFSAVLNPKLDLSKLSPSLTTRQRAKVVERMKARHARELLATLGKHICHKAVRRKP